MILNQPVSRLQLVFLSSYKNIFWIVGGKYKIGDNFNLDKKYYKNIYAYIIGLNKIFLLNSSKIKLI